MNKAEKFIVGYIVISVGLTVIGGSLIAVGNALDSHNKKKLNK